MNWLSQEEIKRRAAISPEEALNVSIEEWESKCEAVKIGQHVRRGFDYCGLCQRYNPCCSGEGCENCCLYLGDDNIDCCQEYIDCCQEYQDFSDEKSLPNAQAMLNRLYMERGKRYGKEGKETKFDKEVCKKEKVEPRC